MTDDVLVEQQMRILIITINRRRRATPSTPPSPRASLPRWTIMRPVFESADAREGAQAFAEKRPPVWRGE